MRISQTVLALSLAGVAVGCTGKTDIDSGGEDEVNPFITGTVTASGEASADIAFYKAFAFDQGGKMVAYFSSNRFATCSNVAEYLRDTDDPYNPSEMFTGGHCNMSIVIDGDYNGSFEHTRPAGTDEPNLVAAGTSMECAMGTGEFELTRLTEDDRDHYYWSGRWWQGRPNAFVWSFEGGEETGYTMTMEMTTYDGGFIHEELDDTPAEGRVSGTIEAEWCTALGTTAIW